MQILMSVRTWLPAPTFRMVCVPTMKEAIPVVVIPVTSCAMMHAWVRIYLARNLWDLPYMLHIHVSHILNTVNNCPECGDNGYCNCYTNFECSCYGGYTGNNGTCEGTKLHEGQYIIYIQPLQITHPCEHNHVSSQRTTHEFMCHLL